MAQDVDATFKPSLQMTMPPSFVTKQKFYHFGHYKIFKPDKEEEENKQERVEREDKPELIDKCELCEKCANAEELARHQKMHKLLKLERQYLTYKTCSYCTKSKLEQSKKAEDKPYKGQWTCCLKEDENAQGCCVFHFEGAN